MPRANRHFLPGHVWHITHRCHHKQFLLKFARDRRRYVRWLFEATRAYAGSKFKVQGFKVLAQACRHCKASSLNVRYGSTRKQQATILDIFSDALGSRSVR